MVVTTERGPKQLTHVNDFTRDLDLFRDYKNSKLEKLEGENPPAPALLVSMETSKPILMEESESSLMSSMSINEIELTQGEDLRQPKKN